MGLEKSFQSSVLEYLNSLPGCKAENVSGNANQSGRPDINGCYNGRMFKIELQSPDTGYKPSKKQELELRKWKNVGCAVGVVYTFDFLKHVFDQPWPEAADEQLHLGDGTSWFSIPVRKVGKRGKSGRNNSN